jgi:hypothetical protein
MAGMTTKPFLIARIVVDSIFAALFVVLGMGEFTARIHGWPSITNLLSVALCLFIAFSFILDLIRTRRRTAKSRDLPPNPVG